jgi:hypothetical protein
VREIEAFLARIAEQCPAMQSVWLIGERDQSTVYELLAFADLPTLQALRSTADLHSADVALSVVIDGDHFQSAWGSAPASGSLYQWEWQRAGERDAYYSEAKWSGPVRNANVHRKRRRAVCIWPPAIAKVEGKASGE